MEELAEKFSKVSNPVILEHYSKLVSKELNLNEETVTSMLTKKYSPKQEFYSEEKFTASKKSPHEFMIALLLKAPLDTSQSILYKLAQKDFINPALQEIFTELKDYNLGRKRKFDIKYFSSKLAEELQNVANELYLWDIEYIIDDPKKLEAELESTLIRIKRETAKKELKELTDKIRQAELGKNTKLVSELSEKFKNVSERLL